MAGAIEIVDQEGINLIKQELKSENYDCVLSQSEVFKDAQNNQKFEPVGKSSSELIIKKMCHK